MSLSNEYQGDGPTDRIDSERAPSDPSAAAVSAPVDTGYLAELQAQIWAMEPRRLEAFLTVISRRARADVTQIEARRPQSRMRIEGRTAVIAVHGILLREIPWWFSWLGIEATSYGDIQRQVREAQASEAVDDIHLDVSSPGGEVGGISEAVEALFAAREAKALRASIDEMGASAAYWLAATAQEIVAEPNALVGSIGVYTVLVDSSARAAREGLTVHVIRGGDLKGAGIAGAPVSAEQLANHREVIEDLRGNFVSDVAEGRSLSQQRVHEWATGAIWVAARAQQLGLIDGVIERTKSVQTEVERTTAMEQDTTNNAAQGPDIEALQSQATAEGRAAEQAKLKSFREAFADDIEFALASYDAGMTLEQARAMHALQGKRLKDAKTVEAEPAEGSSAIEYGDSETAGTADHEDFLTESRRRADVRQISMTQAMQELAIEEPKLHEAYLEQCQRRARPVGGDRVQRISR